MVMMAELNRMLDRSIAHLETLPQGAAVASRYNAWLKKSAIVLAAMIQALEEKNESMKKVWIDKMVMLAKEAEKGIPA